MKSYANLQYPTVFLQKNIPFRESIPRYNNPVICKNLAYCHKVEDIFLTFKIGDSNATGLIFKRLEIRAHVRRQCCNCDQSDICTLLASLTTVLLLSEARLSISRRKARNEIVSYVDLARTFFA